MSSSSSKKSASVSAADDINFDVSLYTDMVLMAKEPKKNKSIPYADRVANKTPDGQLRRGTTTYRTPGARSAILRLFNSVDVASLGDDLVMITLKYKGSRAKRLRLAPNDESVNGQIERFDMLLSEELGTPAKFLWFKDFNDPYLGGGVHGHFLLSRGGRGARGFDRLVRGCWAEASGQEFDAPGENAWTPTVTEFWYGETPEQTFKNFVRYEAQKFNPETGEVEKKIAQKRVDKAWLDSDNYQVKWAGISDALIPATPRKFKITCACGNADIRSVMQKHSPAERNVVQFDCRENLGEKVDIDLGRWSYDLTDKGCTEFIRVTPDLIEDIAAVEEAHAGCTGPATVEAVEAADAPATTPEVSTPAEANTAAPVSTAVSLTEDKESTMNNCPSQNLDYTEFEANPYKFLLKLNSTMKNFTIDDAPIHDLLVVTSRLAEDGIDDYSDVETRMMCIAVDALVERYRWSFEGDEQWANTSATAPWEDPQLVACYVFGSIVDYEERLAEEKAAYEERMGNHRAMMKLIRLGKEEEAAEAAAAAAIVAGAEELVRTAEVTGEMEESEIMERVAARAEVIKPRVSSLLVNAGHAPVSERKTFAAKTLSEQFAEVEESSVHAALVEIPRIANDPESRRPQFVARLANRTEADLDYLAALVRMERNADEFVADLIPEDELSERFAQETALMNSLLSSGKMTPIPRAWLEARREGAL
ncbi:hypothetical protein SAMN04489743_2821 [Pseudarthrobacter equi]|uniref:Uncharacterized protein n=1 Tax=Pseudarthrobacter equi TaxID=728066 RepID=A0A1H2A7D4_9MICC|nr:hypothetical protein [Pseudarthrobacter equi]SDT41702.1 hypothetical protein SAMN04489743_2821 [Pseudarthrobacter equi]